MRIVKPYARSHFLDCAYFYEQALPGSHVVIERCKLKMRSGEDLCRGCTDYRELPRLRQKGPRVV